MCCYDSLEKIEKKMSYVLFVEGLYVIHFNSARQLL